MTLVNLELGDVSGDGHNISKIYYATVTPDISAETLYKNCEANIEKIGFGPDSFAEEYEDSQISETQWQALVDNGMSEELFDMDRLRENEFRLWTDDMIRIVMFYYTHGLDVTWEETSIDSIPLLGFGKGVPGSLVNVGYGLFFT